MANPDQGNPVADASTGLCAITLVFTALSVTGFIDWPWWVIVCPLWLPVAAVLVLVAYFVFISIMVAIVAVIGAFIERIRW